MAYTLFDRLADHYDWHTPPQHYQHDHEFVLSRLGPCPSQVLDIGCGTGVFLEKAIKHGFDATGLDASPGMVSVASKRVGIDRVRTARMQDLSVSSEFNAIVSLSWSFNYVRSFVEAKKTLRRFKQAIRPDGQLILQIVHAPNATGHVNEDRESGPDGELGDIIFLYRFHQDPHRVNELRARYVYGCKSRNELVFEEHRLRAANAKILAAQAEAVGFVGVELLNSWRGDAFETSVSAFLVARTPSAD